MGQHVDHDQQVDHGERAADRHQPGEPGRESTSGPKTRRRRPGPSQAPVAQASGTTSTASADQAAADPGQDGHVAGDDEPGQAHGERRHAALDEEVRRPEQRHRREQRGHVGGEPPASASTTGAGGEHHLRDELAERPRRPGRRRLGGRHRSTVGAEAQRGGPEERDRAGRPPGRRRRPPGTARRPASAPTTPDQPHHVLGDQARAHRGVPLPRAEAAAGDPDQARSRGSPAPPSAGTTVGAVEERFAGQPGQDPGDHRQREDSEADPGQRRAHGAARRERTTVRVTQCWSGKENAAPAKPHQVQSTDTGAAASAPRARVVTANTA